MAWSIAAMKAKLGSTDYWITSMKAGELIRVVTIPTKMKGWDNMSIEERYRREIKSDVVRHHIAPYLATDKDRFLGAIILAVMNHENMEFEPLDEIAKIFHAVYGTIAKNMGVLTFSGGEIFVPLDGVHRIKAVECAITGKDEKGKAIDGIMPCDGLADDDVTVILMAYDPEKSRKIATSINLHPRSTKKGPRTVTNDHDIVAVLARKVANEKIGARLVNYRYDTLSLSKSKNDGLFTTLSAIYNCNERILETFFCQKIDEKKLPPKVTQALYQNKVFDIWDTILEGIDIIADAMRDKTHEGDDKRREIREHYLLGRPVIQECLVRAFMFLTKGTASTYSDTCRKLNALPWVMTEENMKIWQGVFWTGGVKDGRMITANRDIGTRMIVYLAGGEVDEKKLLDDYVRLFPDNEREGKTLPPKIA